MLQKEEENANDWIKCDYNTIRWQTKKFGTTGKLDIKTRKTYQKIVKVRHSFTSVNIM